MSDAGYTLTETLAAMAVIGLAIGGVSLGMEVLGGQQSAVGATVLKTQHVRALETWLERALAERAPFRAHEVDSLSGTASGFRFDCKAAQPCTMDVVEDEQGRRVRLFKGVGAPLLFRLPGEGRARFLYRGAGGAAQQWPPQAAARDTLRSVTLLQGEGADERVVFEARVHVEQPKACAFDAVLQDCR